MSFPILTKNIIIRCAKCQIFGIWHIKHKKTLLMRYSKSYKFWHTWTVLFRFWNGTDRCAKKKIYFFIHFLSLLLLLFFLPSFTFFFFLPPSAPIYCHSLFPFSSSFFSSIFTTWLRVVFFFFFVPLSLFFIFFLSLSLSLSRLQPSSIRFQFNLNCLRRRGRWGFKAQLADWSLLIFAHPLAVADLKLCLPSGSRRSLLVILHSSCRRSRCQWLVEFGHWLICWVGALLKILSFFFFILVEVFGFGICGRIRWLWL